MSKSQKNTTAEVYLHSQLTMTREGGEQSAPCAQDTSFITPWTTGMWAKKLSGLLSDEKIFFSPLNFKPSVLSCVDGSLVTVLTELYWLLSMHKTEILIHYKPVQVSTPKIPNGFSENFT